MSVHATETLDSLTYALPYEIEKESVFKKDMYITTQWMSTIFTGLYAHDDFNYGFYSPILASGEPTVQLNGTYNHYFDYAMKLTVTLKPGLTFSDGTPLTADDVVYTYRLALSSAITLNHESYVHSYLPSNDSIIKVDDVTVEFHVMPYLTSYYKLLDLPIIPQEIYQPAVDAHDYSFTTNYESFIIGAGPFMLESMDTENNVLSVVRNPNWVGRQPSLERIYFKKIPTQDQAIEALENGVVQLVDKNYEFTRKAAESLNSSASIIIPEAEWKEVSLNHIHPVFGDTAQQDQFIGKTYNYSDTQYTIHSYWKDQGITDETSRRERARLVREAMDTVIPRETIINESLDGLGVPLATVWLTIARPSAVFQPRSYNLTAARGLMEQAGFDYASLQYDSTQDTYTTFFFNITVLSPVTSSARNHIALYLQNYFPKIGIGVTIEEDGWAYIVPRTFGYNVTTPETPVPLYDQGGYDLMIIWYSIEVFEPSYYGLYESNKWLGMGGFNWYNYHDTTYDDYSISYEKAPTQNIKYNIAHDLQQYFYKYIIVNAVYEPMSYWFYNPSLDSINFEFLSLGICQWELIKYEKPIGSSIITSFATSNQSRLLNNQILLTESIILFAMLLIKKITSNQSKYNNY